MYSRDDFLTALQDDWHEENMIRLRASLAASYVMSEERSDPNINPFLDTPNRLHLRGYLRWYLLNSHLVKACQSGFLIGITPYWVTSMDYEGSIQSLELRGKRTALMLQHLAHPSDPIRDSRLRLERTAKNQQKFSPYLAGFEPASLDEDHLVNVMLVHGDKMAEFAYFRVYNDVLNLRSFIPLSGNIMAKPYGIPAVESEEIKEAEIVIRHGAKKRKIG